MTPPLNRVPELLLIADRLAAVQRLRAEPPVPADGFYGGERSPDDALLLIERLLAVTFWNAVQDIAEAI